MKKEQEQLVSLPAGRCRSIYVILLILLAAAIAWSMVLLAAPLSALEMGASEGLLGALVAAFVASGTFLSLPGGVIDQSAG